MNPKKFLADKGVGYFLTLVPFICAIISLILYYKMGKSFYTVYELSPGVLVCLWATVILLAAGLVINFKPIKYAAYLTSLLGLILYIVVWGNIFGPIALGTDGERVAANIGLFRTPMIFIIITFVFALVSAIMSNWQPWAKKEKPAEEVA